MNKSQKNVDLTKKPYGSFPDEGKEPFSARLRLLQADRSLYQTAKDWGVNLSTLKNYFSRQGSIPRHEVLSRISRCEGVSVEWLLYGGGSFEPEKKPSMRYHR